MNLRSNGPSDYRAVTSSNDDNCMQDQNIDVNIDTGNNADQQMYTTKDTLLHIVGNIL
jgi:hypothetical protein